MRFGRDKKCKTFYMNAKVVVILLFDKIVECPKTKHSQSAYSCRFHYFVNLLH